MPNQYEVDNFEKRLFKAKKPAEQAAIIDEAISRGMLNDPNSSGRPLFITAASKGRKDLLQLLIDKKAEINAKTTKGSTALILATWNGHTETVQWLLENNADPNQKDNDGFTPLMWAADKGYRKIADLLSNPTLVPGLNLEDKDNKGRTALWWAMLNNRVPTIVSLISKGADTSAYTKESEPFMMQSVALCFEENRPDDAITLLKRCIDVYPALAPEAHKQLAQHYYTLSQDPNHANDTPPPLEQAFMHALSVDRTQLNKKQKALQKAIIQTYLSTQPKEQAASIEKAIEDFFNTPYSSDPLIIRGSKLSNKSLIQLLLNNKVDVNTKNPFKTTALMWAADKGSDIVPLLLENGANPTLQNKNSETALIWATGPGHVATVKCLLEHDKENKIINLKNSYGHTALHLAAQNGHAEIAGLLLKHKADVNIQNNNGLTPLASAVLNGRKKVVKLLLENKVNPDQKDNNGFTPLMWAADKGYTPIAALLLEEGAKLEEKDRVGRTALSWALTKDQGDTAAFLISKGADTSDHVEECQPFMIAAAQLCFKENRANDGIALLERCINIYPPLAQKAHTELAQYYYTLSKDKNYVGPLDAAPPLDKAFIYALSLDTKKLNKKDKALKDSIIKAYFFGQLPALYKIIVPILEKAHTNPTLAYEMVLEVKDRKDKLTYSTSKVKDIVIEPVISEPIILSEKKVKTLQQAIIYLSRKLFGEKKPSIQEGETKKTGEKIPTKDANKKIEANFTLANNYLKNYNNPEYKSDEMIEKALKACLAIPSTDENSFYYRFKEQIINIYLADPQGNSPDLLPDRILSLIKSSHEAAELAFTVLKIEKELQNTPDAVDAPNALNIPPSAQEEDPAHKKPALLFSPVNPPREEPDKEQDGTALEETESLEKPPKSPKT